MDATLPLRQRASTGSGGSPLIGIELPAFLPENTRCGLGGQCAACRLICVTYCFNQIEVFHINDADAVAGHDIEKL